MKHKKIRWSHFSVMLIFGLSIFIASIYAGFSYLLETSRATATDQAYDYFALLQANQEFERLQHRLEIASVDPSTATAEGEDLPLLEQLGIAWVKLNRLIEGKNATRLRQDEALLAFKEKADRFLEQLELTLDKDLNSPLYQPIPDYVALQKLARPLVEEFKPLVDQKSRLLKLQEQLAAGQASLKYYFGGILLSGILVLLMYGYALKRTISMAKEMAYQASHDLLTRLFNRSEIEQRVEELLTAARLNDEHHSLCYMDLDNFKIINDTCGHEAGDELLKQLSPVLQSNIRPQDMLARLGGDEFAVILYDCEMPIAEQIAERLRETVQDFKFSWAGQTFDVTISIGAVSINKNSDITSAILSDADAACFLAKERGRNRIYLGQSHTLESHKTQMAWVSRISQAFKENRFRLYHQPIVPIQANHVEKTHYEVLVRMLDEEGKIIPPGIFLPAAERYNQMVRLDRWIIRTLFEHLTSHPEELDALEICSVNLSGLSIGDRNFTGFIVEQFESFGMPTHKVCFEITETAAITNIKEASKFIRYFKEMGCRFSLDDFGSGMSSFAYLKGMPVDYLKIDGGFVKDMISDHIDRAMVDSIHRVGHVLGLKTIAEYVENDQILALLRDIGVDYAQGYGIGKPQPLTHRNT
ncbi:EAL domain-containing protein [Beggiatoa leptomitoformis]|uniref:EAL domain-containing protein n=1 Tax=Beggiatoa leptomitoformis TaxID=288004 RepID=A0A2N9YBW3_9GAMM|nr:EAL domain-containing protein [Beggiatoa leptomitoformis]AUI67932.1 EAL domain-containing protein [Beggiatoa leptomitoformis]QGX03487.1 EAL domain-containing protein [Beggiatoa leptomitoformis]